jgi:Zn-dependent protease with chaperone function
MATLVVATFAPLAATVPAQQVPDPTPGLITSYDIATRDDLLFGHLLAPLMMGDVTEWPILSGLGKQLGDWIDGFVGAQKIANIITEAFPIEGRPALRPLAAEVEHCARILGLARPRVDIRNSPFTQAYVVRAFDQDHLVLTSGLLDLYAGQPEELKFVIGHELGHVKCGHLELKSKAFGLMAAVQAINLVWCPTGTRPSSRPLAWAGFTPGAASRRSRPIAPDCSAAASRWWPTRRSCACSSA